MSKTNYKDDILKFYNNFLAHSDINNSEAVAWSSKESQIKRFEILLEIGVDKKTSKFLDLGCGLGHLVDYLRENGYDISNYTGIDINQHYIFYAELRNKNATFKTGEIFDLNEQFDYVIGSGNFTVKMPVEEILKAIAEAYKLSTKGVAFNFLTYEFFGSEDKDFNCFVPEEFFAMINKIYPKTRLVTDYLGNEDFTIYIYK
jgi:SAM-dependent methyltransferase